MTRHYTFTVSVDDDADPGDWMFIRALLDTIEPGAGSHTLGITHSDRGRTWYHHHRLNVDISAEWVER